MKKVFLAVALTTLLLCNANAQNSDVEIAMQETKTEKFLKECNFVREDQISSYVGKGLEVYGKIFTDLTTGKQIAALEFYTQNQRLAGTLANVGSALLGGDGNVASAEDMAPRPLGYLDMENVQDLLTALEDIVTSAHNSSKKDIFSINYTAPGGIDVYFSQGIKDIWGVKGDAVVFFRKKWYGINEYGVRSVQYTRTEGIKIENIAKLIPIIKDAQTIATKQIKNPYVSKPTVVTPAKSAPIVQPVAPQEEPQVEPSPALNTPTESIADNSEQTSVSTPLNIDDYKTQLNQNLVKVVQAYSSEGLSASPICKSYMQVARLLIKAQNMDELKTLDNLTVFIEGLLDKYQTKVDKKALEKQLSSKKTAEEMLMVFKTYLQ